MHPLMFKLLTRANVVLEENDGQGGDLPGGLTAEQIAAAEKLKVDEAAAEKAKADKEKADKEAAEKAAAEEAARKAAGENGDKPQPTDAEAKLLKELMQNKAKAKETADALAALKSVLGDVSVDDVAKILAERKDAERKDLEKRGEYDRILEQVRTEHAKEIDSLKAQLAEAQAVVGKKDETLVEMTVGRAFSESPFIREKSVLPASIARREFGAHVDLVDGVPVVYDKPRGTEKRTPLVDAQGKAKSFEEGIAQLYSAHPDSATLIKVAGKPGAASTTVEVPGDKGKKQTQPQGLHGHSIIAAALDKKNQ